MPIQSTDTTSQITFTEYGQVWLIKAGVAVATSGTAVYSNFSADLLTNLGTITSGTTAVSLDGANSQGASHVVNEASGIIAGFTTGISTTQNAHIDNKGSVSGTSAIRLIADSCSLVNSGVIHAQFEGVFVDGSSEEINNSGTIEADSVGVRYEGGDDSDAGRRTLSLTNTGLISGNEEALLLEGAGSVQNSGRIEGDIYAASSPDPCTIINSGQIHGDILFSAAGDLYDGRVGQLIGSLSGGGGNDTLVGGQEDNLLDGGAGRDRLDGGKGGGEDSFVYTSTKDSPRNAPDVISRHWTAADTIDLSGIDPDTHHAGDQAFAYGGLINAGDQVATRSVEYFHQGGDTYVVADTNGDGQADFEIIIRGNFTLNAGEFVL